MATWLAFLMASVVGEPEAAPEQSVHLRKATGEQIAGNDWSIDSSQQVTLRTNEGALILPMKEALYLDFVEWTGKDPSRPATAMAPDENLIAMPVSDPINLLGETGMARSKPMIVLADGQFVTGEIREGDDETLSVSNDSLGKIDVPISAVECVLFSPKLTHRARRRLIEQMRVLSDRRDTLLLANDDILSGTIEAWNDAQWTIEIDETERKIEASLLRAAGFDRELIEYERPGNLYYVVSFKDGSTLHADRLERVAGKPTCRLHLAIDLEVEPRVESIARIGVRGGDVIYLSDIETAQTIMAPFLDDDRPPSRDEGFSGDPIFLSHHRHEKGIVTRGYSRLDFRAEGAVRFLATLGVDASAGDRADFVCSVLVDGKEAYRSRVMTIQTEPEEIDLPLERAETLSLIVDYGSSGDVDDAAVWADARLLRK